MGFPLPEEPDVTEFVYYLVAIPDAPEYRQAVKGHFSELGRAHMWGLERVSASSYVAAQSWLRAIDETWRLIEMGWPDLVIEHIDDVEALLAALQNALTYQSSCCGDNQTFEDPAGGATSSDPVPQPIIDAGYATGTSDYTGYNAYKCMAANLLLNNLEGKLLELSPLVQAGAGLLSLLLVLFGAVSGIAGVAIAGVVIGVGDLLTLIDALKDLGTISLEDLASEMESYREDLVCAMMLGDGIDDTLEQFNDTVDSLWGSIPATIIKNLNVRHMVQLLMYGSHGNTDIASELAAAGYDPDDYDCTCAADLSVTFTFDSGVQSWDASGNAGWNATCQSLYCGHGTPDGYLKCDVTAFNASADPDIVDGHTYRWRRISFDYSVSTGLGASLYLSARSGSGSVNVWSITGVTEPVGCPTVEVIVDLSGLDDFAISGDNALIEFYDPSGNGAFRIDNVRLDMDDVT